MGGFRFNGCGVTDHYKKIKHLGIHSCPNCKKLAEFTLDEANQKIDVLWIPTLTLKSRYAVMCKKCKTGEFCSTEWAGYLLNQTAPPDVIFESEAKGKGWSPAENSFRNTASLSSASAQQSQDVSQFNAAGSSDASAVVTCPNCGNREKSGSRFCSRCGQKLEAETSIKKNCPHCGAEVRDGMLFCIECGTKI